MNYHRSSHAIVLLFSFVISTLNSAPLHAAIYKYLNGKNEGWVVVTQDHKDPKKKPGIYWSNGRSLKHAIKGETNQLFNPAANSPKSHPKNNYLESPLQELNENHPIPAEIAPLVVEVDELVYLLWPSGNHQLMLYPTATQELVSETRDVEGYKTQPYALGVTSFVSEGHVFAVVTHDYLSEFDGENMSDVVIVRDDGLQLPISVATGSRSENLSDNLNLNDGILSLKGTVHKIDLRNFEIETKRSFPLKSTLITGDDGETINAIDLVNKYFPDVLEDTKLQDSTYKMEPKEFSALVEGYHSSMIGSAVVLGPAGVGKTEYLRSFFAAVRRGEIKGIPRTVWVPYLDLMGLNAGTKYVGTFESRLSALLKIAEMRPTILFMDEIHAARGAGTHESQSNDVFQSLKPLLANGSLRIFGTDTPEEFDAAFSGDAALAQRFARITRQEFDRDKTFEAIKAFFKKTSGQIPGDPVIRDIYRLSSEFNAVDSNPRKSNRLADKLQAQFKISGRAIDSMTTQDVATAAQELYDADPAHFSDEGKKDKLLGLRAKMDEYLVGHEHAKDLVSDLTLQAYTNSHDVRRPRLRMLLAGDRGLGKTEFGFAYARAMSYRFHRVEMNRFEDSLNGADDLRREIASELAKNAFTVFLVDEVEKAPLSVQNALLGIMDDGIFSVRQKMSASDRFGVLVRTSARNAAFILTTNAGKHLSYNEGRSGIRLGFSIPEEDASKGDVRKAVEAELIKDGLSPYLVDRMQALLIFKGFSREQFRAIIKMHVENFLREQSEKKSTKVNLPISEDLVIDRITNEFYHPRVSGREAIRAIQDRLRKWYSNAIFVNAENDADLCERLLLGSGAKK